MPVSLRRSATVFTLYLPDYKSNAYPTQTLLEKTDMNDFILWGVIASPYLLKMQALLDYAEQHWKRYPEQGGRLNNLRLIRRLLQAKSRGEVKRYPQLPDELDEYPAVPFYSEDGETFYYDSSALAHHLDNHAQRHQRSLLPAEPEVAFVCQLIDEAFDEFGLYMVHHMRWVGSAKTTPMGEMTAAEMAKVVPFGLHHLLAKQLPKRQVRRLPYLFSVAPHNYGAGVSPVQAPPVREGFPETHSLLNHCWEIYLEAMENILGQQPYLLGQRFTLADASAYGQLSMNLVDGDATARLHELAPRTYTWLCDIRDGKHVGSDGPLVLSDGLQPLLEIIGQTFVPLMQQNAAAYEEAATTGETLFNETAFDQGRALYEGQLLGSPFKAVVKTFQVRVWQELCESWCSLVASDREHLKGFLGDTVPVTLESATGTALRR